MKTQLTTEQTRLINTYGIILACNMDYRIKELYSGQAWSEYCKSININVNEVY